MIQIFCALLSEAKPLINHFKMTALCQRPYPIYHNARLRLFIGGIGKVAMAGAVAYSYGRFDLPAATANLNMGIAGHAKAEIGSASVMLKVVDGATGQVFYPVPIFPHVSLGRGILHTVDQPELNYPSDVYYDMEGAGFVAMAIRFSSAELNQVYKIVSDNASNDIAQIDKSMIGALVTQQLGAISELVDGLEMVVRELSIIHQEPQEYAAFKQRWHCTQYQSNELYRLLQRWQTLAPDQSLLSMVIAQKITDSKTMLGVVKTAVAQLPIRF